MYDVQMYRPRWGALSTREVRCFFFFLGNFFRSLRGEVFFFWNLGKKAFFFFFFTFEFFSFIVENNESDAPFDRWIRSSERECHVFASRGLGLLTRARVGKRRSFEENFVRRSLHSSLPFVMNMFRSDESRGGHDYLYI